MTCSRSGWLGCCRGAKTWTPPSQPRGADDHKNLQDCCGWVLTWPKTQIRLVKEQQVTQRPNVPLPRRPQQPVTATTSRHQQLLAAAAPLPPHGKAAAALPPPHGRAIAALPPPHGKAAVALPPPHGKAASALPPPKDAPGDNINDDDDDDNPDNWINTSVMDSLFMPNMDEPYRVANDPNARTRTCTRLDFHGTLEETPPDAGAAGPYKGTQGIIFSPTTLHKAADERLLMSRRRSHAREPRRISSL